MLLLKSLLRYPTAAVLAGVRFTGTSYDAIRDKLLKSYGSDKLIINRYVKKLITYQAPTASGRGELNAKTLRRCYDDLNNILRQLMFVDADILTSERILVELLMIKSPQLLQVDIELSEKPKNTIQDYFTIHVKFITARECAELMYFPRIL